MSHSTPAIPPGTCRACGCRAPQACALVFAPEALYALPQTQVYVSDQGRALATCWWVEADLCSGCAELPASVRPLEVFRPPRELRW